MKIRIERRLKPSKMVSWSAPMVALLLALLFSAYVILIAGANPLKTYLVMLTGAYHNWPEVIVKAIPLTLCGLAVALAAQAGFTNTGAEGQLALGGIGASGVALFLPNLWPSIPGWLLIFLMVLGGATGGALWGLVPAALKLLIKANEILTNLMSNYIAILLVQYLYYGPWRDPEGRGFPGTALFISKAWFPCLGKTRIHLGLLFAVTLPLFIWFILKDTKLGYQIKMIGNSEKTAIYAGMNLFGITFLTIFLSAGIAALAGVGEVGGILHRLHQGLTAGYGYTGLIIAWLANLNPWGVLVVSILLSCLLVGGDQVQISMGLPAAIGGFIQGVILLAILGCHFFTRYQIRLRRE